MEIYVKKLISIFLLYLTHDFVIYVDFAYVAASNVATDDVTNEVTHRIFITSL